jgi:hypothetical protein
MLNFDTSTYHFSDIDLSMAIKRLPARDSVSLGPHKVNDLQKADKNN